jgi:hypothetical protein
MTYTVTSQNIDLSFWNDLCISLSNCSALKCYLSPLTSYCSNVNWLYGYFTSSWHIQLHALHKDCWHQCLDEKVASVQVLSAYEWVEVLLHSCLTMALLGVKGQLHAWATLSPIPTEKGARRNPSHLHGLEKKINLLPVLGITLSFQRFSPPNNV